MRGSKARQVRRVFSVDHVHQVGAPERWFIRFIGPKGIRPEGFKAIGATDKGAM